MSLMKCDICDRCIDTDYDVEGMWAVDDKMHPSLKDIEFICGGCMETRCPDCGRDDSCYECAAKGGWSPE